MTRSKTADSAAPRVSEVVGSRFRDFGRPIPVTSGSRGEAGTLLPRLSRLERRSRTHRALESTCEDWLIAGDAHKAAFLEGIRWPDYYRDDGIVMADYTCERWAASAQPTIGIQKVLFLCGVVANGQGAGVFSAGAASEIREQIGLESC